VPPQTLLHTCDSERQSSRLRPETCIVGHQRAGRNLLGAACAKRLIDMTGVSVEEAKSLICDLCRQFYDQGWVSGTGGGISVKAGSGQIVMAPSGVQKERMQPSDMFVLDSRGEVAEMPKARPPPYKPPKLSECSPLFMSVSSCLESQQSRPARPTWAPRAAAETNMVLLYTSGCQQHAQCGHQQRSVTPNHIQSSSQFSVSLQSDTMTCQEALSSCCYLVGCHIRALQQHRPPSAHISPAAAATPAWAHPTHPSRAMPPSGSAHHFFATYRTSACMLLNMQLHLVVVCDTGGSPLPLPHPCSFCNACCHQAYELRDASEVLHSHSSIQCQCLLSP
jgi:hypothetical protein